MSDSISSTQPAPTITTPRRRQQEQLQHREILSSGGGCTKSKGPLRRETPPFDSRPSSLLSCCYHSPIADSLIAATTLLHCSLIALFTCFLIVRLAAATALLTRNWLRHLGRTRSAPGPPINPASSTDPANHQPAILGVLVVGTPFPPSLWGYRRALFHFSYFALFLFISNCIRKKEKN